MHVRDLILGRDMTITSVPVTWTWDEAVLPPDRSSCRPETEKHTVNPSRHLNDGDEMRRASYSEILQQISTRDFRAADLLLHQILRR